MSHPSDPPMRELQGFLKEKGIGTEFQRMGDGTPLLHGYMAHITINIYHKRDLNAYELGYSVGGRYVTIHCGIKERLHYEIQMGDKRAERARTSPRDVERFYTREEAVARAVQLSVGDKCYSVTLEPGHDMGPGPEGRSPDQYLVVETDTLGPDEIVEYTADGFDDACLEIGKSIIKEIQEKKEIVSPPGQRVIEL